MATDVDPSPSSDGVAYVVAKAIQKFGAVGTGWIVPTGTTYGGDISATKVSGGPFGAFAKTGDTGFDVTFDTGEAFVGGSWLAKDTTTTVTLASSTNGQTIEVGWDADASETVLIGERGTGVGDTFNSKDPSIKLYTFDTDGSGVTSETDERTVGKTSNLDQTALDAGTELARFLMTAVSDTPVGTAGNSTNELWRAPSGTSDLLMSVNAGGRMNIAWNAYHDGSDWRYITDNERAYRIQFTGSSVKLHVSDTDTGTAGNIVTWVELSFEGNGDLLSDSGTTIWNESQSEVPRTQLGGAASSLSTHPIPAGDIDDGSGSSLDADTVDGQHASQIGGGTWTSIGEFRDTDTNSTLTIDTGTLGTTYDQYYVVIYWECEDGGAQKPAYLDLQFNNNGSSVYSYGYIDQFASEVNGFANENRFRHIAGTFGEKFAAAQLYIVAPDDYSNDGYLLGNLDLGWPDVHHQSWGNPDARQMHTAKYEVNGSSGVVDQLTFRSDSSASSHNAAGVIELYGRDFAF